METGNIKDIEGNTEGPRQIGKLIYTSPNLCIFGKIEKMTLSTSTNSVHNPDANYGNQACETGLNCYS